MDKVIILKNGKKLPVIREDEKYLYCKGTQFKRNHPDIAEIIEDKPIEKEFEKLPDMEEIEKEIASEEKMIENIAAESKAEAKKNSKKGD